MKLKQYNFEYKIMTMEEEGRRHRYTLKKYDSRVGKEICPKCDNKSLVLYVDTYNNNEIINKLVGRCDHITHCKYMLTPYEYFRENGITEPAYSVYDREINNSSSSNEFDDIYMTGGNKFLDYIDTFKPVDYIPEGFVRHSQKNIINSFTMFLHKYLNEEAGGNRIDRLIEMYCIGTGFKKYDETNDVIFWQRDINNKIRTGRVMHFDDYGKRWKKYNNWAHLKVGIKDFNVNQCLFGEHLLNKYPNANKVFIVESDKSAILLKNEYLDDDNIIVMSAGNQEGLSIDKFKVFEDMNVEITLIPDIEADELWIKKAKYIHDNLKIDIEVFNANDFIMKIYNDNFTLEKNEDIADYLIQKKLGLRYITGESFITKT